MRNVLIVGATFPQTIADPDGKNPQTRLGGAAPALAQALLAGNELRATLLTALQRDDLGKATIKMLENSGLLYRAVDCQIATAHRVMRRRDGAEPQAEPIAWPKLTRSIMNTAISQTAPDYDYVIADCSLDPELLFDLGRVAQKFIVNGTSKELCLRVLASNPWPKAAVKLNLEQAGALIEFIEAKHESHIKDALHADRLLITKDKEGWTLYDHNGQSNGNATEAIGHSNYDGAGDAALAGLVQAVSRNNSDPTEAINQAIAGRLAQNPA